MPSVAACQFEIADLDPARNVSAVIDRLDALPSAVDLAVFPEYGLTGFVANDRVLDTALSLDDDHLDEIAECARANELAVLVGFLEDAGDDHYNTLLYLDASGGRAHYRKRHLWGDEDAFVTPGTERVVVDTPIGSAGLVTCYDLNFVAESAAFADPPVDALLVGGAWPAAYAANWDLLLRARALDGVRWVVGAGRTGIRDVPGTDRQVYAGRSAIIRPDGSLMGRLNRKNRDLVRDIDPDALADHRAFIGSV